MTLYAFKRAIQAVFATTKALERIIELNFVVLCIIYKQAQLCLRLASKYSKHLFTSWCWSLSTIQPPFWCWYCSDLGLVYVFSRFYFFCPGLVFVIAVI